MSVLTFPCVNCSTSSLSLEDLERMNFVCDGQGHSYRLSYPISGNPFCGIFDDTDTPNPFTTRVIGGETHRGIYITHNLGKINTFVTMEDQSGVPIPFGGETIDANTIFVIIDDTGITSGSYCVM